ncbi:MAG: galactose mutarotase [Bacteroidales bacterium]|nr:galactose mutarotase [Bacteroidales bacterium]
MKKIALLFLAAAALAACSEKPRLMQAEKFQKEIDGKQVDLYTIAAGDITLQATNYGARVVSIFTPDAKGKLTDIVVGHDNLDEYVTPPGERFLGACVGPVANRIGNASFTIEGETYNTPANDKGKNTLHGGFVGVDHMVWDVVEVKPDAITLHLVHPDGMEGYPGNLDMTMTYTVNAQNEFIVTYDATTDKTTPVSFSNHPFFCLRGEGNGTVEEYEMTINASSYTPVDEMGIPTGEILPVEGTPFDFREPHLIGERIGEENQQLANAHGYDHNWCIDKTTDGIERMCRVHDPVSGRTVEVFSDQPGLQFYSGNFFFGEEKGSNGNVLEFRSSLVLEAQKYPDAVNHDNFTPVLLRPGEKYTQTCIYRFSAD